MTRADLFTEKAMTRSLFENPIGEYAREDEWSGPHGFALGGMMQANRDFPGWIVRRMKELAEIDPGSTAFRYGAYGTPIDAADQPMEFEAYVSLSHLQAAMPALNTAPVSKVDGIKVAWGDRS